ncbi:hypothetical protein FDECE_1433 [Fusarium decemcellulare]|nr:hypothetical protein FDECE_1433 [Fusarium decemcellulare]
MPQDFVIPRPGGPERPPQKPISGPDEAAFVKAFGQLLPPAKFLSTATGKAAYYELPPSAPSENSDPPHRVLFLHGVQTPALGMLPLARALHASHPHAHIVLVDLWGHGLTETPIAPHDAGLFLGLVDALLDELNWPSAHLVGYSFGGNLTARYVTLRPSRVQSFVLVAPAGLFRLSNFSAEDQVQFGGDDQVAAWKWVLNFLEGGDLVVPADWKERVEKGEVVAEAVKEWQMREHLGHTATVTAIFRDAGVMDSHAEFLKASQSGIPSIAILGEFDEVCNEQQLKEQGFENVTTISNVGHAVVRTRVSEVAGLVGDFWSKRGKATTD